MATASVSFFLKMLLDVQVKLTAAQSPPLYLHITSTTREGLEKAVQQVEELMKQELPNLVDERRFRRREPEQVERDEYGRVSISPTTLALQLIYDRGSGPRSASPSTSSLFLDLTYEHR